MQNAFSTLKVLIWNLLNVFHFSKLEKLRASFLKPDQIPKLQLLKPNVLLSTMVTILWTMVIARKCYGNIQRVLKTNINETTFLIWVFFHKHLQLTRQQRKKEAISLTPPYYFHPFHGHLDISWEINAKAHLCT